MSSAGRGGRGRPAAERLVAAKDLFRATGDAEPVVEFARSAIRKEAETPSGLSSTKEVEELIFWLGALRRPLAADLQAAHDTLPALDPKSAARPGSFSESSRPFPRSDHASWLKDTPAEANETRRIPSSSKASLTGASIMCGARSSLRPIVRIQVFRIAGMAAQLREPGVKPRRIRTTASGPSASGSGSPFSSCP